MSYNRNNSSMIFLPVFLSFLFAFCFMVIPMSQTLKWLRPDFITLFIIYWVANVPNKMGIIFAFMVGIFFDLLTGGLIGSSGLTLAIIAFFTINFRLRLRIYSFWQKIAIIMLLVSFSQLLRICLYMLTGHPSVSFMYLLSSISSALLWPVLCVVLDSTYRPSRFTA